jgi:glycosyltransferase involved in cell wall biosynthesis
MARVHIVHCIARLNEGGPARVLSGLAGALVPRGHRLTVIHGACDRHERDCAGVVAAAGAELAPLPALGRRVDPLADLRAFALMRARLAALRPDVVHTHTAKAGALGRIAARSLGLPCLHTYHGHVLHSYFGRALNGAIAATERALAGNAWHQGLTASQVHDLRDVYRIGRPGRWRVLPVPVPAVAPAAAPWHARLVPGLPVVGFLGRLVPVKDGGLWLKTFAELARRMPVQGLVCGDGPERAALEAAAAGLPGRPPVLFAGMVPAGEALQAMRVLLVTSRNEGQPLTVVEAACAGVPVVAPPVGGLADLIAAGAAVGARREPAALAAAVAVLLDPARARAQVARGRRVQATLLPAALAGEYERWYQDIVRAHARARA